MNYLYRGDCVCTGGREKRGYDGRHRSSLLDEILKLIGYKFPALLRKTEPQMNADKRRFNARGYIALDRLFFFEVSYKS